MVYGRGGKSVGDNDGGVVIARQEMYIGVEATAEIGGGAAHQHVRRKASSIPPKPRETSPKFQPKKSPEITAPTPMAQRCSTRACRRNRRSARYSSPAA